MVCPGFGHGSATTSTTAMVGGNGGLSGLGEGDGDQMKNSILGRKAQRCVTICPPFMYSIQHHKRVPLLRRSLYCSIHTVTGGTCENT